MDLIWSAAALSNLKAIHAYIAADSPGNADRMVQRIHHQATLLLSFPEIGRPLRAGPDQDLREIREEPFRVIYAHRNPRIEIIAVIHQSRNLFQS
jgi:toxin ParE1/3/4